jgi:sugar phosphate isomerase/epimerase
VCSEKSKYNKEDYYMAKIYAPNKQYSGISASVVFVNGVGETENPTLLKWFKDHGYEVEVVEKKDPPNEPSKFDGMDVEQLKAYAAEHNIEIGNASSVNGILKKITDAEKKAEEEKKQTEDKAQNPTE